MNYFSRVCVLLIPLMHGCDASRETANALQLPLDAKDIDTLSEETRFLQGTVTTVADAFCISSPVVEYKPSDYDIKVEHGVGSNFTAIDRPTEVHVTLLASKANNKCGDPLDGIGDAVSVSAGIYNENEKFSNMAGKFSYDISIDLKNMNSADQVTFANNGDDDSGDISFCAKVTTESYGVEIIFQKIHFQLGFNLSAVEFELGALTIEELDPLEESEENMLAVGVNACVCDSILRCKKDIITVEQNEELQICLYTDSENVRIKNFALIMENSINSYEYDAVVFGENTWDPRVPTTVVAVSEIIKVTTIAVAGLFDKQNTKVNIKGSAQLEFIGDTGKTSARSDTLKGFNLELFIDVDQEQSVGCISKALRFLDATFK